MQKEMVKMGYVRNNLGNGEQVIYEAKISWATILGDAVIFVVFCWTIIIPLYIIFKFFQKISIELGITNKRVIGKVGIISTTTMDSPLNKVQNVIVSSGFFDKFFGCGTVEIITAGGNYKFKDIGNPEAFRTAIMNQIDKYGEEKTKKQAQVMANAVVESSHALSSKQ
jgi:uncharacterized membrane protein YdbT with pleckstrin-like domain